METKKADRLTLRAYFRQLSRMYSLSILTIFGVGSGILALQFDMAVALSIFSVVLVLHFLALFLYEPWKIMGTLNKGLEYQQGIEALDELRSKREPA
jgi:hypothetical protein